jgi:response regulator of citrate/malate metabolism
MDGITASVKQSVDGLNASEAAKVVGVSRVTAWRYLERLADDGLVTRHTEYGKAGRPQVRYVWR